MTKRIPFGQERKMLQISTTCRECGVPIGSLHSPGCEAEECPRCHKALMYCRCVGALTPGEDFHLAASLSVEFDSRSHAAEFLQRGPEIEPPNLIETAAYLRVVADAPDRIEHGVTTARWNGDGTPQFSDKDVMRALALSGQQLDYLQDLRLERQRSPSNCWC